jgi:hypothetical protein
MHTTVPSHWLKWGLTNFLLRLASNHNPLDLCLPSSQDYKYEPLHLVRYFNNQIENINYYNTL